MPQNTKKYINHTEDEIDIYLKDVKKCISRGKFQISNNSKRLENKNFINQYRINTKKQKEMLLEIEVKDFCYSVDNDDNPNERFYVFAREYELDSWGIKSKVVVYIKTVLKDNDYVVVISFHEPKKKIKKLFI